VRGLQKHRYAGDAALFANADLRIYVSRFRIFLPGEWGILGFADAGRVYLDGESSNEWHTGFGGGLGFAWLDRANTVSLSFSRSKGRNAAYVKAGFAF
jgi:hemolysin activation/secretion protein